MSNREQVTVAAERHPVREAVVQATVVKEGEGTPVPPVGRHTLMNYSPADCWAVAVAAAVDRQTMAVAAVLEAVPSGSKLVVR